MIKRIFWNNPKNYTNFIPPQKIVKRYNYCRYRDIEDHKEFKNSTYKTKKRAIIAINMKEQR